MTDNIHGRCVWDCEHTVVDHQSVLMNFADGATATLNMIGGTAKPERNIHIIGTKGEIKGVFDDSVFTVRTIRKIHQHRLMIHHRMFTIPHTASMDIVCHQRLALVLQRRILNILQAVPYIERPPIRVIQIISMDAVCGIVNIRWWIINRC